MPRGLQQKGLTRRNKMLLAAVKLFLENGYEKNDSGHRQKSRHGSLFFFCSL